MTTNNTWEYRFQRLGGALREAKEEDVKALLDEWGEEGWEVINFAVESGKLMFLAKRPLTTRIRRQRSMPGYS